MVATLLVSLEATHAYVIARGLMEGAMLSSRALASEYRQNPNIVSDTTAQQNIFSNIRLSNLIHDNSQFQIVNWQLDTDPKTVCVRVTYIPGAGDPALPAYPSIDPLGLGGGFRISQTSTYRLRI